MNTVCAAAGHNSIPVHWRCLPNVQTIRLRLEIRLEDGRIAPAVVIVQRFQVPKRILTLSVMTEATRRPKSNRAGIAYSNTQQRRVVHERIVLSERVQMRNEPDRLHRSSLLDAIGPKPNLITKIIRIYSYTIRTSTPEAERIGTITPTRCLQVHLYTVFFSFRQSFLPTRVQLGSVSALGR